MWVAARRSATCFSVFGMSVVAYHFNLTQPLPTISSYENETSIPYSLRARDISKGIRLIGGLTSPALAGEGTTVLSRAKMGTF